MTAKRINQLPVGSSVTDTSYFADEDSSNSNDTEKLSALQFYTYLLTKFASTPIETDSGGTGVDSPTDHGILIGRGASPIGSLVLNNGQILIGENGNDPAPASITAGAGIVVTPGAGAITISSTSGGAIDAGIIWGCQQSWFSNTEISMLPGTVYVRSGSSFVPLVYPSLIVMDISTNGINGLDTGSVATNTWYYIWSVGDASGNNLPGWVFSTNNLSTGPTMPVGYNLFRLVGCAKTNPGTNQLVAFYFSGSGNRRTMTWDDSDEGALTIYSGTDTSQTLLDTKNGIPPYSPAATNWIPQFQASLLKLKIAFTPATIGNRIDVYPTGSPIWMYSFNGFNTVFPNIEIVPDLDTFDSNALDFNITGAGGGATNLIALGFTFEV